VYITHLKNVIKQLSYTNKYHTVTEDGEKKMTLLILREAVANALSDRIDFLIDALVPLATVFASNSDPSEEAAAATTTTTLLPEHVALAASKIGIPAMILRGGPVEVSEKPTPKPKRVKKLDRKTAEKRRISDKITRKEEEVAAAAEEEREVAAAISKAEANGGNDSDSSSSVSLSPME